MAILNHAFWSRQFNADPAIVSRQISLDGVAHTVVGVMPANFRVPGTASDLWVPLTIDPADRVTLWSTGAPMIGRLRPGATLEQARSEIRLAGTRDRRRMANVLVATQVAVAVVLVVGAALLATSFRYLVRVDPGFRPEQLISATIAPPVFRYRDDPSRRVFFDRLVERVAALPDVRGVGVADSVPFSGANYGSVFVVEGRPHPGTQGGDWPWVDVRAVVSPDYLRTLGVPMVQGRGFTDIDRDGAEQVVLFSETLARSTWGTDDPLGQRIRFPGDESPWRTVARCGCSRSLGQRRG